MRVRDQAEDLVNVANRDVWGARLVYTPHDGVAISVSAADGKALLGVFDAAHVMVQEVDGVAVSSRAPVLDMALADLGAAPHDGDKFLLQSGPHSGETYTVIDVQYDSAQAVQLVCVGGDHSA